MQRRFHRRGLRAPRQSLEEEAAKRTEALLRRLPPREWSVLPGMGSRGAVDHVLVGPSGVFAITSHAPATAAARVREGVLWLRHDHDARADRPGPAINRHVLDAARTLHREIRSRTGRGPEVHPVVVLWCEFPQRVAESSRIAFVHGRDLPTWVAHRPAELDAVGRAEIVQALLAVKPTEPASRAVRHIPRPHIPLPSRPGRRAA